MNLGLGLGLSQSRSTGGASSFVPSDISGLMAWYDAQDAGTITTVSGDVSQWDDKSVNANHLTQTTASLRPAYTASDAVANNKPAVVFPDASSQMFLGMATDIYPAYFTAVTAYKDGVDALFDHYDELLVGSNERSVTGRNGTADWHYPWNSLDQVRQNNGAASRTALPLPLSVLSATEADAADPTGFNDFIFRRIGRGTSQGAYAWRGPVCEVILYSAEPSVQERADLHDYLYAKWGITP